MSDEENNYLDESQNSNYYNSKKKKNISIDDIDGKQIKNVNEAREWFQKAADRNDPDGLRLLAELYDEELGDPENGIAAGTKFEDLPEEASA